MDFLSWHTNEKKTVFCRQYAVDGRLWCSIFGSNRSEEQICWPLYRQSTPNRHIYNKAPHNAAIHTECCLLKNVVTLAAEAECGGLFHNAQATIRIRRTLEAIGHMQHPTPIKTDNKTANSFVHSSMQTKHSKTWDMRYHWLREKSTCNILKVFWDKGTNNNGDYFIKHHSPKSTKPNNHTIS